jgi:PAS domain S-box-containing protein
MNTVEQTTPLSRRPGSRRPLPTTDGHGHRVQFYDGEGYLSDVVGGFLGRGLAAGEALVVIATPDHRAAFRRTLEANGFDVGEAITSGQLTLLDARETLDLFMVDDMPDGPLFRDRIGAVLEASARFGCHAPVRAYGEMVDLLVGSGNPEAALKLEELWNELARVHPFVLLCAYAMAGFSSYTHGEAFRRVCDAHTHVAPAEDFVEEVDPEVLRRQVSLLQQRARALETEIAQRRNLEAALRAREQELTDFLENAVEGLHWIGRDGVILWANSAELALLGYERDEYVGHHIAEFHVDRAVVDEMLARLLRQETLRDFEARMRARDGSIKHVLVSSNALFRNGQFVHTRCFTRDITDRRRLDDELKRQNEALTRQVHFSEMFVGILGHDLRNPVSAVMTAAGLLLRRYKDEGVASPARRILVSSGRMGRMIDQLLDFTRIRLGQGLPLQRGPTDLTEVCRNVSDELEPGTAAGPIQVKMTGDPVGAWDADRLGQLLSNLLTNALSHGTAGAPVVVRIEGTAPDRVRLEVCNQGAIPAELRPIIFEPFRSGTERKGERSSGLGLGLYISKQIVVAHGGTIEVGSLAGDDTTFTIHLPRQDPTNGETHLRIAG